LDESLLQRLSLLLEQGPVIVASVLATRGATPRKGGSRMLIAPEHYEFSVGGGEAEARVITTARALLSNGQDGDEVHVDLSGRPGAAGICGGRMQIALRRWAGPQDLALARSLSRQLSEGHSARLPVTAQSPALIVQTVHPNPRLVIVGAGHCGHALHSLAQTLDFDVWVFDSRPECFSDRHYIGATVLCGSEERLWQALDTQRELYAVLLNRNYAADIAALRVLGQRPLAYLGMMGSKKRIATVRAELGDNTAQLTPITAPVGLDIGAHTPAEIAVSIAAQLIAVRAGRHGSRDPLR